MLLIVSNLPFLFLSLAFDPRRRGIKQIRTRGSKRNTRMCRTRSVQSFLLRRCVHGKWQICMFLLHNFLFHNSPSRTTPSLTTLPLSQLSLSLPPSLSPPLSFKPRTSLYSRSIHLNTPVHPTAYDSCIFALMTTLFTCTRTQKTPFP
jgi:hypothetical protein